MAKTSNASVASFQHFCLMVKQRNCKKVHVLFLVIRQNCNLTDFPAKGLCFSVSCAAQMFLFFVHIFSILYMHIFHMNIIRSMCNFRFLCIHIFAYIFPFCMHYFILFFKHIFVYACVSLLFLRVDTVIQHQTALERP